MQHQTHGLGYLGVELCARLATTTGQNGMKFMGTSTLSNHWR